MDKQIKVDIMKIGIVGAGLGGLLTGALLSNKHDVVVFEKLPFLGGRFTNLEYEGFQLTTGALHMIPHGNDGYLGYFYSAFFRMVTPTRRFLTIHSPSTR